MSSAFWRMFSKLCCYIDKKTGDIRSDLSDGDNLLYSVQGLVSSGEYSGLAPLVRAEGVFVQYNADGSYYRRVGLGITHKEFLIATQIFKDDSDEIADTKIDLAFPLPVLHFFMLDNRAKRFAVCTCVGVLMFFEMCEEEKESAANWDKWRRVIFLQMGDALEGSPWQPIWVSPFILNLAEKNDMPLHEFLKKNGGKIKRKLQFTQHPFTLKVVRSFGIQTDGDLGRSLPKFELVDELKKEIKQVPKLRLNKSNLSAETEKYFENLSNLKKDALKNWRASVFDKITSPKGQLKTEGDSAGTMRNLPRVGKESTDRKSSFTNGSNIKVKPQSEQGKPESRTHRNKIEPSSNKDQTKFMVCRNDGDKTESTIDSDKRESSFDQEKTTQDKSKSHRGQHITEAMTDKEKNDSQTHHNDTKPSPGDNELKFKTDRGKIKSQSENAVEFTGTVPDQRLSMFYGGCRLLQAPENMSKKRLTPIRRSCSSDDLHLSNCVQKMKTLDKMLIYSWNTEKSSIRLHASNVQTAKKYHKFSKTLKEQTNKSVKQKSGTASVNTDSQWSKQEDCFASATPSWLPVNNSTSVTSGKRIRRLKRIAWAKSKRSGRELWLIARKKLLCKNESSLLQFRKIVSNYVFKVNPSRKDKLVTHLTELSSLSVSLELFCVSRKLFLSLTAFDATVYQTSKGKEQTECIRKILEFSGDIRKLVISQILCCADLFDRIDTIKLFVEVSLNLLMKHHDFQTFFAVMRALTSPPIYRLRNTWATFYMEYSFHFIYLICMGKILSSENGFVAYTSRIKLTLYKKLPSVPWIEHFLMHCTLPQVFEHGHKEWTRLKQVSTTEQHTTLSESKRATEQKPVKPILQKKQRNLFEKWFMKKKNVRFSSNLEIAERRSSVLNIVQKYEGHIEEDRENLDLFCEEAASTIIDEAMKDIENHQSEFSERKSHHQKTSGKYLSEKSIIAGEDMANGMNKAKAKGKVDNDENSKKVISGFQSNPTNNEMVKHRKTKIVPSTSKEQNIPTSTLEPESLVSKGKENKINTRASENKEVGGKDQDRKLSSPITENEKFIPMQFEEKTVNKNEQRIKYTKKSGKSSNKTDKDKQVLKTRKKSPTAQVNTISKTKPFTKDMINVKGGFNFQPEQIEQLNKKPLSLPLQKNTDTSSSPTNIPKNGYNGEQTRKRKMSVMEMKKMNRRMSLFETAETKKDDRKDNVVDYVVQKRMTEWRRKGSVAEGLEPGKENTRNIISHDMSNSNTICLHDERYAKRAFSKVSRDFHVITSTEGNNNAVDNIEQTCEGVVNSKSAHPCRSWSGTNMHLSTADLRAATNCKLCENGRCVYSLGLWKTLIKFHMNVLKMDVNSHQHVSSCLKALMSVTTSLSDTDLFNMSLKLEPP